MQFSVIVHDLTALMQPFIPAPSLILLLTPIAAAYAFGAASLVGRLRTVKCVRAPYTRKIFHFTIFTMAGIVQLVWGLPGVVIYGSVVTLAVLWAVYRGDRFPFYEALARPSDHPRRTLFILVPLLTTALGGVLANLWFPAFAYVGYLVCGWGDALGEPVGTRWGRHRYRVPSLGGIPATRSVEGSAAVFIGGAIAAFIGLAIAGYPLPAAAYLGAAAGLAGAIVEAVSTHGLDNLTVQLAGAAAVLLLA